MAAAASRAWVARRTAREKQDTTSENQAATVRDQEGLPHRVIRHGEAVRPLPPHARSLADLALDVGEVRRSLGDYMTRSRTVGLLILKDGEVALERYGIGRGPERCWTSYSTAKSMPSTLVGAALHDGAIRSLDDRCENYLPRVRGSAYEGVTLRNVMRMCSGVAWNETDDAQADVGRLQQALASRRYAPRRSNRHRARCTLDAPHPAISCLGASRTPTVRARGSRHNLGVRETCTKAEMTPTT
jgi:CubicO group peptidase (beta-lactamase class C family)